MKQSLFLFILSITLLLYKTAGASGFSLNMNVTESISTRETEKPQRPHRYYTEQAQNYYSSTLGLSNELASHYKAFNVVFRITGIGDNFKNFEELKQDMDSVWSNESLRARQQSSEFSMKEKNNLREAFADFGMTKPSGPDIHEADSSMLLIIIASNPFETGRLMQYTNKWAASSPVYYFKHVWLVASARRYSQELLSASMNQLALSLPVKNRTLAELGHVSGLLTEEAIIAAFFNSLFTEPTILSRHLITMKDEDGYNNDALLNHIRSQNVPFCGYSSVTLACTQPFCPEAEKIVSHYQSTPSTSLKTLYILSSEQKSHVVPSSIMITEYLDALKQYIITDHALTSELLL